MKGLCHAVKSACQADKDLSQPLNRGDQLVERLHHADRGPSQPDQLLIRLTNALVSFSHELISLSHPLHRLCKARISLTGVSISLIGTENGLINAFIRL